MVNSPFEEIKLLIEKDKIGQALQLLTQLSQINELEPFSTDLSITKGKLERLERDNRIEVIDRNAYNIEKTKITLNVLEMAKQIEEDKNLDTARLYRSLALPGSTTNFIGDHNQNIKDVNNSTIRININRRRALYIILTVLILVVGGVLIWPRIGSIFTFQTSIKMTSVEGKTFNYFEGDDYIQTIRFESNGIARCEIKPLKFPLISPYIESEGLIILDYKAIEFSFGCEKLDNNTIQCHVGRDEKCTLKKVD